MLYFDYFVCFSTNYRISSLATLSELKHNSGPYYFYFRDGLTIHADQRIALGSTRWPHDQRED